MNYFYIENEEQKGPVTIDEISKISITEVTLIWHEGLNDWTEAKNIPSLESIFKKVSPPKIPVVKKEPPKFEKPTQPQNENFEKVENGNRKTKLIAFVAGGTLLLIIVGLLVFKSGNSDEDNSSNTEYSNSSQNNESTNNDSYNNGDSYDEPTYNESNETPQQYQQPQTQKPKQQTEDEIREQLYNKEISNPTKYLSADGTYRVNLAANTIVEGTVYNSASMAGFKNVKLTAKFYSKTDVLLGKESFMVMEYVSPGGSASFKYKISGWWDNIDHWTLSVNSAESY